MPTVKLITSMHDLKSDHMGLVSGSANQREFIATKSSNGSIEMPVKLKNDVLEALFKGSLSEEGDKQIGSLGLSAEDTALLKGALLMADNVKKRMSKETKLSDVIAQIFGEETTKQEPEPVDTAEKVIELATKAGLYDEVFKTMADKAEKAKNDPLAKLNISEEIKKEIAPVMEAMKKSADEKMAAMEKMIADNEAAKKETRLKELTELAKSYDGLPIGTDDLAKALHEMDSKLEKGTMEMVNTFLEKASKLSKESPMFESLGIRSAAVNSAEEKLNKMVEKKLAANTEMSKAQAEREVYTENPALYAELENA